MVADRPQMLGRLLPSDLLQTGPNLAIETNHHLFDTLYHAVTLENEDALLVTADDRNHMKAKRYEMIAVLHDWEGTCSLVVAN